MAGLAFPALMTAPATRAACEKQPRIITSGVALLKRALGAVPERRAAGAPFGKRRNPLLAVPGAGLQVLLSRDALNHILGAVPCAGGGVCGTVNAVNPSLGARAQLSLLRTPPYRTPHLRRCGAEPALQNRQGVRAKPQGDSSAV